MLDFLIKKYIKSYDFKNKKNRDKLIKISGFMGLFINLILFLIKIIAGYISGSISIISDSINNLSDSMTSVIAIFGSVISSKPADEEHPYGHGRSEYIATMVVGIFIIVVGFQLILDSFKNILNPNEINSNIFVLIILIFSILFKIYMFFYNRKIYKIADSLLNKSVAIDAINDIIATSLVLFSMILNNFISISIDGYIGIIISLFIIKSGIEIFIEITKVLLGKEIDKETIEKMKSIILKGQYTKNVHKIEIHEYGKGRLHGSCHVQVPANIDVYSMHKIINEAEEEVFEKLGIDLTIHADPAYMLPEDKFYHIEDISLLDDIDY